MITQQLYKNEKDIRNNNLECGDGICCFQNPKFAENEAGIIDVLGYRIKIILMCRVNPKKIRQPINFPDCWILNPTPDEIRHYRILIKNIPFSPLTGTINDKIIVANSPVNYIVSAIKSNDFSFNDLKKDKDFEFCSIIKGQIINDDLFAIRLYSSIFYQPINTYLRNKQILNLNLKGCRDLSEDEIKSWICCLQLALSRNANVKEDTVVYRGVKLKFPPEIGIGSKFYFREFISTSIYQEFAEKWIEYEGTILVIKIKNNGINGHKNYCYYIEDITYTEQQDEVLFSSHCFFTVTNIKHEKYIDYIYLTCEGCLLDSIPETYYNEINILYKVDNLKKIKIFGDTFVEKNRNNCKIIFNKQEYELNEYFDLDNIVLNENILKIKLKEINNITDMSCMFQSCEQLLALPDIHKWNTENITHMSNLFNGCNMTNLPDISKWDTRNVTHLNGIFSHLKMSNLPDISKWNTKSLTNIRGMFYYSDKLNSIPDISEWNTSKVTDFKMIFFCCNSLTSLPDLSKWNTSKVTTMSCMFQDCLSLISLPDISKWDTSNVTDMTALFFECRSLKKLPDLSKWNTKNVTSMYNMFEGCENLLELPDISTWNTDKVTQFGGMFNSCIRLSSLPDISKWNTHNVYTMRTMFFNCKSLSSLPDISKWDLTNLQDKELMFSGCNESLIIPDKIKY